jgi:hypothetical protein
MKRKALALTLILALLALAGVILKESTANFVPPPANTVINIETPQNIIYNVNTVPLNFTVETNLGLLYFYSLNGQERKPIDNITTISEELLPDWSRWWDGKTPIYRKMLIGTCLLSNLSKGWHNLTVYQIYPLSPEAPQEGNVVYSANVQFSVSDTANIPEFPSSIPSPAPTSSPEPQQEAEPFPTALVIASVASIITVSLTCTALFYFKKRER